MATRLEAMDTKNRASVRAIEVGFREIYSQESDAIFRFCLMRTSDREMALDFTQDTFMRFWNSFVLGKDIKNPNKMACLIV